MQTVVERLSGDNIAIIINPDGRASIGGHRVFNACADTASVQRVTIPTTRTAQRRSTDRRSRDFAQSTEHVSRYRGDQLQRRPPFQQLKPRRRASDGIASLGGHLAAGGRTNQPTNRPMYESSVGRNERKTTAGDKRNEIADLQKSRSNQSVLTMHSQHNTTRRNATGGNEDTVGEGEGEGRRDDAASSPGIHIVPKLE